MGRWRRRPDVAAQRIGPRAARGGAPGRRTRAALHAPTVRAREAARAGDAATYAVALTELASIPVPTVVADAH